MKKTHLPGWLSKGLAPAGRDIKIRSSLNRNSLSTICEQALCPNRPKCFSQGTATFLILGPKCTRDCAFCAVPKGTPAATDFGEIDRIITTAKQMDLSYVVITSVTRDDLIDGGAGYFVKTIKSLKDEGFEVEVLVPDFAGSWEAIAQVAEANPTVFAHDIQTVPRLYPYTRPKAQYDRSLSLLTNVGTHFPSLTTKTALLVGLGEETEEIKAVLVDLAQASVNIVVIGQYIQPCTDRAPVSRWWAPEELEELSRFGSGLGFLVYAAPLARSSYRAAELNHSSKMLA